MSREAWTAIGIGVAIAVLLVGMVAWLRSDMKDGFAEAAADRIELKRDPEKNIEHVLHQVDAIAGVPARDTQRP